PCSGWREPPAKVSGGSFSEALWNAKPLWPAGRGPPVLGQGLPLFYLGFFAPTTDATVSGLGTVQPSGWACALLPVLTPCPASSPAGRLALPWVSAARGRGAQVPGRTDMGSRQCGCQLREIGDDQVWSMGGLPERALAPVDERGAHAVGLGADAVEGVVGHE